MDRPATADRCLYTRNPIRETELFGLCPVCRSPLSKTVSGKPGMRFVVVCPAGHDRVVNYDKTTGRWVAVAR